MIVHNVWHVTVLEVASALALNKCHTFCPLFWLHACWSSTDDNARKWQSIMNIGGDGIETN